MSKFKPVRVNARAIPATDVPDYWLPVIIAIDPNIRRSPSCSAVVPKLCASREAALGRAEMFIERECSTWRRRRDGWRVAPNGDTLLPDHYGATWLLQIPEGVAA